MLVEDVVSSGGAIVDAVDRLEADGLRPSAVLCVIDRETGGRETVTALGVPFRSLFTFAQIDGA